MSQSQDIVAEFAVESQEHLRDIENELLAIEEGGANIDVELVNKVFRSVHSIKGAAGFLGFTTIGELSHGMENVLNLLRNRELVPDSALIDVVLKAADALRGLVCNVEQSNGVDVAVHLEALRGVISRQAMPAAQASVDKVVEFQGPDGYVLSTTELTLNAQRTIGHKLYMVDLDLIADVEAKGRTPLDLLREMSTFSELLDSQVPLEGLGSLEENAPPPRMRFLALLGSIIEDTEMLAAALQVDQSRVTAAPAPTAGQGQGAPAPACPAPPPPPAPVAQAAPAEISREPELQAVPAGGRSEPVVASGESDQTPSAGPSKSSSSTPADTSIRVSVGLLDHLMNLAGELVLGRNQLLQVINTQDRSGLDSVGARLNQVTSELQEAIMQTRMQPIGSVFSKFPRVVRDLSNKLGKQCDLFLEGKEVELDKSLLEAIADPLTHLVRNSVDHGIETPAVRTAANKSPTGRVILKAAHQAGKVCISITDDGRGIDPGKIRKKAVETGLITAAEDRDMSDRDAVRLIFLPGFSTASQVTDVSGRGVGMDVVKTNIEKAGGTVEIDNHPGAGMSVNIRLPLTLAIVPSLIVRCRGERYAIPQVNINELVRIKAADCAKKIEHVSGAEVLRLRGSLLPLVRLDKALGATFGETVESPEPGVRASGGHGEAASGAEDSEFVAQPVAEALHVIVVETGHLRYGLVVDGLQDSEEIVVKPLGSHLKGTSCLAGATILGDGHVALILDVPGIAGHCKLSVPRENQNERTTRAAGTDARAELQTVLLFTNDPNEQFGIPMGLISRLERIRTSQIDSVGGQDVLQYRGASLPLLVLERHIKARPRPEQDTVYVVVFRVGRQEVGLVAPTLVDIRDINALLDVVTFREPGVLGSTVVEDHATRLIDLVELVRVARPEWLNEEITRNTKHAGHRILLAEDSNFFRKQVEDLLRTDGYDVLACEDGEAAWQALQDADPMPDLVMTDIEMPNLDGYGLTSRVKNDPRFKHLPVIAVTSLAGQEDMERGRQAGVDEYQIKLDRDQLVEAVRRYLKSVTAGRAVQSGRTL